VEDGKVERWKGRKEKGIETFLYSYIAMKLYS